jgi:DNA-binding CsgD family transcriptional regulator
MFELINIINNPNNCDVHSLPASIYWKNKAGIYIGRNYFAAQKMHQTMFEKTIDIAYCIGQSDHDLYPESHANDYRENDLQVINNNCLSIFEEKICLPCGTVLTQVSSKKPMRDKDGTVIGIMGITFDVTDLSRIKKETAININTIDDVQLNPRAIDMLRLLVRGKTFKEIGKILHLSNRTVEHYIDNIKKKLNVKTKGHLIDKVIDHLY